MPRIYRSMARDGDFPKIGPTAQTLGARVPGDIPEQGGIVQPGTGGISVSPSWRNLPTWRIPKRLIHLVAGASGKDTLHCWCMGEGPFVSGAISVGLQLRKDGPSHALVEPSGAMTVDEYQARLAETQESWQIDES